jgi:epoxyqueuosine reductase
VRAGCAADAAKVKALGRQAGFDLVRIVDASVMHLERARYLEWIEQGRQAGMAWMTRERAVRSSNPSAIVPEARSVISVGLAYGGGPRPADSPRSGRVARYAWGRDYHAVLGERFEGFSAALRREWGGEQKWYVDTGPVMDKAVAARSGLGWYGKNTNILTERFGSYVLLGEVITTLQLEPDLPLKRTCGSCRLCLLACPTGALGLDPQDPSAGYTIDSARCISYLTIEHRGPIPRELRPLMGNWVFGCDICQDVCPPTARRYLRSPEDHHRWAAEVRAAIGRASDPGRIWQEKDTNVLEVSPHHPLFGSGTRPQLDLLDLLWMTHETYVETFRGTAVKRAKVWMLRRNAAVALGNVGDAGCRPALIEAMRSDQHPIARGHAAWALGRLATRHNLPSIQDDLGAASRVEGDAGVREEISLALRDIAAAG